MSAGSSKTANRDSGEHTSKATIVRRFETRDAFLEDFEDNLAVGALFVPTDATLRVGDVVELRLELAFCDAEIDLTGEVVAVVDSPVADLSPDGAGVSLRLTDSLQRVHADLRERTGLELRRSTADGRPTRRAAERSSTDADIVLTTPEGEFGGQTANLSYAGVLALLSRKTIPVGTEVGVTLSTPMVELDLCVEGRVIHVQRCDDGINAHGIQLHYPAERIDEVMPFIEFLQSFDRARRLANVAGDIDERGVSPTLEMFVTTAPGGTLVFQRDDEVGKIVFSENFILHCTVGMVSGVKALARLARWTSGRFEFHHDQKLPDNPEEPQPFEAMMMMASVQLDEIARVGFDTFQPNDTFEASDNPAAADPETLTELEREICEYALDGFNVGAISDMVAAPDADILKALAVLVDVGVVSRRR